MLRAGRLASMRFLLRAAHISSAPSASRASASPTTRCTISSFRPAINLNRRYPLCDAFVLALHAAAPTATAPPVPGQWAACFHSSVRSGRPPTPTPPGPAPAMSTSEIPRNSPSHDRGASRPEPALAESEHPDSLGAKVPLPGLPAPGEGEAGDATLTPVEVNGKPVMLDQLGPMVVGRDGSLSRIANWGEMTELERENTLRILGKRNQLRLGALRAAAANKQE